MHLFIIFILIAIIMILLLKSFQKGVHEKVAVSAMLDSNVAFQFNSDYAIRYSDIALGLSKVEYVIDKVINVLLIVTLIAVVLVLNTL